MGSTVKGGSVDVTHTNGWFLDDGIEILDEEEALRLAATRPVGRVAVSISALPAVLPVTFALDGRDVLFRSAAGTKLSAALRGAVVAFEVDDFDESGAAGWSVLFIGRATVQLEEPDPPIELGREVDGPWVRIATELVTARRVFTDATTTPVRRPAYGDGCRHRAHEPRPARMR